MCCWLILPQVRPKIKFFRLTGRSMGSTAFASEWPAACKVIQISWANCSSLRFSDIAWTVVSNWGKPMNSNEQHKFHVVGWAIGTEEQKDLWSTRVEFLISDQVHSSSSDGSQSFVKAVGERCSHRFGVRSDLRVAPARVFGISGSTSVWHEGLIFVDSCEQLILRCWPQLTTLQNFHCSQTRRSVSLAQSNR